MIESTSIAVVLMLLIAALCGVQSLGRRLAWPVEWSRKIIHLMMGFTCAMFPWIFEHAISVWITAIGAALVILIVRSIPMLRKRVGGGLFSIQRVSFGDLLFAPAVALVFDWSEGRTAHFLIPVLLLTIADAAGALIGVRYGIHQYHTRSGKKSVEGSTAFFLSAFAVVFGINHFMAGEQWEISLLIAAILASLAMMVEAIADRGFDNLTIPVASYILYDKLHQVSFLELRLQAIILILLLVLLWFTHKKSSLSGGALQAAILLCYGCYVLGGWTMVVPLLLIYGLHVHATHSHGIADKHLHGLSLIIGLAIPVLLPLSLWHIRWIDLTTCRWMVLAAAITHIALIKRATSVKLSLGISLWHTLIATLFCAALLVPLMQLPLAPVPLMLTLGAMIVAALFHENTLAHHLPDGKRILCERVALCLSATIPIFCVSA